jgi:hypothetical protein
MKEGGETKTLGLRALGRLRDGFRIFLRGWGGAHGRIHDCFMGEANHLQRRVELGGAETEGWR